MPVSQRRHRGTAGGMASKSRFSSDPLGYNAEGVFAKGIDKPVDLGFHSENIRALGASVVRLSWFHRRCNEPVFTFPGLWKRGSVGVLARFEVLGILKRLIGAQSP
jgi:hypothetical protein